METSKIASIADYSNQLVSNISYNPSMYFMPHYISTLEESLSKDDVVSRLKLVVSDLKTWITIIKSNHWENEEEIVDLMNEINKLSLEC